MRADENPEMASLPFREGFRVVRADPGSGIAWLRADHHAPAASAVALQANGWWHPEPAHACDLLPRGEGWFTGIFEVPADWCATSSLVEHEGPGDPPWWTGGLKAPDPASVHGRTVVDARPAPSWTSAPRPEVRLHELGTGPVQPRTRWALCGSAVPGTELPRPSSPLLSSLRRTAP